MEKILDHNFDFLIMPRWTANDLWRDKVVDAFINVRSMMEINSTVINNYFKVIHTSLRKAGLFARINKYKKQVTTESK